MNMQVVQMVRSLDVRAAQAHIQQTTGNPFVPASSEVNGKCYTGDENALIALYKMRTHIGTPAEIEASKAWLRAQGLNGLFEEPLL
jgi:hypothetical protein